MEERAMVTVAVVEDRADARASLEALIGDTAGFAVGGVYASMEEAIAGFEARLPDVAIVDLGLPGMSGTDGIRLLRERYPKLPLMVLTVFDDDTRIFEAICAGAHGYLLKSTPPGKLLEGVRELMAGGAPMSPGIARRVVDLFRQFRPPEQSAHSMTAHEMRVLKLMAEGFSVRAAARQLEVSPNTVSFHLRSIYGKLAVHSRAEAVAKALRQGFLR